MKWLINLPFLALLVAFVSTALAAAEVTGPAAITKGAYHTAMAHFGFDAASVKLQQDRLTLDLYGRLLKKVNEPVPAGDAPDIEGDVFLDCQDVPTKYEVGDAVIDGTKARVKVTLHWDNDKRQYVVLLTQINGVWKIYDINFGKDGTLTDLLK
jgi:hypothetical protein